MLLQKLLARYKKITFIVISVVLVIGLAVYIHLKDIHGWVYVQRIGIRLPLNYSVHGIDISHHQGDIDWRKIKRMKIDDKHKIAFVYIKATEGQSHLDRHFLKNWKETNEISLRRGAYHFYIPWVSPKKQADWFVRNVQLNANDLPPVLDFEKESRYLDDQQHIDDLKIWLRLIENHYHRKPVIYTNIDFYKRYIRGNFRGYSLWIADYSHWNPTFVEDSQVKLWQHSQAGWIDGVQEKVDFNVFLDSEFEDF